MLSKIFGKKESATRIHRANGMASIAPAGVVDADHICRTVESAVTSIERTGQALVPSDDKVMIGDILERLGDG